MRNNCIVHFGNEDKAIGYLEIQKLHTAKMTPAATPNAKTELRETLQFLCQVSIVGTKLQLELVLIQAS